MRGRILRIKTGYNPNSSSIGTHINAFLLGTAAFAVLVNTVIAVAASMRGRSKTKSV